MVLLALPLALLRVHLQRHADRATALGQSHRHCLLDRFQRVFGTAAMR